MLVGLHTGKGTIYKHLTGCTIDTSDTGENQERTGTLTVDTAQAWQLVDFLTTGRTTIEKIEPHKEGGEERRTPSQKTKY